MLVLEDGSEVVLLVPDAAGTTSDLPAPDGVQSLWKSGALHSAKSTPARIRERAYPLADGQSGAEEKSGRAEASLEGASKAAGLRWKGVAVTQGCSCSRIGTV